MDKQQLNYRMYAFVLYQLSGIQKGIQAQHAISRYGNKFGQTAEYQQWINNNETTIVLTPGGSRQLTECVVELSINKIQYVEFAESDLYSQVSAVAILVDERVWDRIKYPDPNTVSVGSDGLSTILVSYDDYHKTIGGEKNIFLRSFLPKFKLA